MEPVEYKDPFWRPLGKPYAKKEFSPKEGKALCCIILLVCMVGYWAIEAHPPDPPPHVDKYVAHESQPLGPVYPGTAADDEYIRSIVEFNFADNFAGMTSLYGIHIDTLTGGDGTDEIAIYVGEGWDCVLATKEGCIIK
jgi:hypothetical protein